MDWIRACHKKKHTFRRGPRFIVFQGMRCALFWIPHKPEHLRINTSPSTKSSLVGLYSFQGNLQSGGERRSTEKESKTKCRKTWKWFDCYVLPFALQMKTVLLLNTMWHPHYRCSYFILHRSCCLMLWVFIRLCKEKLHLYHPELSQTCPRNSNLDDWLSWRQNLVHVQSPYLEKWSNYLGMLVNELVCLYLDKRHDAIIHLAIQPVLLQCSTSQWRTKMIYSWPSCGSVLPVLLCG